MRSKTIAVPVLAVLLLALVGAPARAGDAATEVERTLASWMADFNAGKTERICFSSRRTFVLTIAGSPRATTGLSAIFF
jgi:hypothetical protein